MTEMTSEERAEEIRYLVEEVGVDVQEAPLRLRDDDLWMLLPASRFVWEPGEEDVRQWELAYDFAYALSKGFTESQAIPDSARMLLWDMRDRAEEAMKRARERAEEA
jgi:hypothetical protein